MEVQHLRHLLAASSSKSFTRAASKCFTSRQNIAHSIKTLEAELGVSLFERQGNTMALTEEGRKAAAAAEEIISEIDALRSTFSMPSKEPTLSMAFSVNLFAGVPDGVDEALKLYCNRLKFFELDSKRCYERVLSESVDIAIVMCMDRSFPKCKAVRVGGSTAYALVNETSHLATKQSCITADLAGESLALMSEPPFQYEPLISRLSHLGYDQAAVNVVFSTSSMIHLVRDLGYISITSGKFAQRPPSGTIAIPIADPKMNWGFYILCKDERLTRREVSDFVSSVTKAFGVHDVADRTQSARRYH